MKGKNRIQTAPKGLAILAFLGSGLVCTSDLIGSGEVILTTRNRAILGTGVLWIAVCLFIIMPTIFTKETYQVIKPQWIFTMFLLIVAVVFGYFFIF